MKTLGIIKETKNKWEKRVSLNPNAVESLLKKGIKVKVQSSPIRIYKDEEYRSIGAEIVEELNDCDMIIGVKEIPLDEIQSGIPHLFFSHTIKGQDYNMPLLQKFLDTKTTLLDYERITDSRGRRLVFFGKFAGNAGMVDALWGIGQRLLQEYDLKTPFLKIKRSFEYESLEQAIEEIGRVGKEIEADGLPESISPFNIFIMGYGHVAQGCMEILSSLPIEMVEPDQFVTLEQNHSNKKIYVGTFKEEHMVERLDGNAFDLLDYFNNHSKYISQMKKYLPYCSVYMNGIYWEPDCPVFLSQDDLKELQGNDQKMIMIGDITCDIKGSVQATVKPTWPDNPIYVYNALTGEITDGVKGEGFPDCAVDNLPCEFAREASDFFSDSLMPFMEKILTNDYSKPISQSTLPPEIKKSVIAHQGKLEKEYEYLKKYL